MGHDPAEADFGTHADAADVSVTPPDPDGAELVASSNEVWQRADLIVKVKEPLPHEWPLLREGQIVQDGPPGDLMVIDGPYRRLIQREMTRLAAEAA